MSTEPTVFVVDDDPQSLQSVCILVRSMGLRAEAFSSAEEFLAGYREGQTGCLVADVRMIGMSGIELLEEINRRNIALPVILITAYARTPLTIRAIRGGAVTVLEKPYEDDDLWDAIRKALGEEGSRRAALRRREIIRARIAALSPVERRVMDMIVQGKLNKNIADELDLAIRTVELRRAEVFAKMQVKSVADLVRLVVEADLENGLPNVEL